MPICQVLYSSGLCGMLTSPTVQLQLVVHTVVRASCHYLPALAVRRFASPSPVRIFIIPNSRATFTSRTVIRILTHLTSPSTYPRRSVSNLWSWPSYSTVQRGWKHSSCVPTVHCSCNVRIHSLILLHGFLGPVCFRSNRRTVGMFGRGVRGFGAGAGLGVFG